MSKLGNFIKSIGRAIKSTFTRTQGTLEQAFTEASTGKVGEVEQRFSPRRILGGYRLRRTGKHRGTKKGCVSPRQKIRWSGSKLWRKAAEGAL